MVDGSNNKPDRPLSSSPLDALSGELDALVARMQTPEAHRAAESLASATPEELGEAAVQHYQETIRKSE